MNIVIKKCSKYQDVKIYSSQVVIELGLHDKLEAKELAQQLREAADELDPKED